MRRGDTRPALSRGGRAAYRAQQFAAALWPRVDAPERAAILARAQMPPTLAALFERVPRAYQAHGLRVARRLLAAGSADPLLLQAALLHDLGKWDPATGRRVRIPVRVATVLLRRVAPGRRVLAALGRLESRVPAWRTSWVWQAHHPARGAAMLAAAGADPAVVALVRHHEVSAPAGLSPTQAARLRALQAADEQE